MKFSAWSTVYIGSITTEDMAALPDQFADPNKPTHDELEKYFEYYQQELAGSNSGSERLANGILEIEPDNTPDKPALFKVKIPAQVKDPDHEANYEALDTKAIDPATGCWKRGGSAQEGRCKVNEEVELYFKNIMVVLKPDGTYYLEDMSGG